MEPTAQFSPLYIERNLVLHKNYSGEQPEGWPVYLVRFENGLPKRISDRIKFLLLNDYALCQLCNSDVASDSTFAHKRIEARDTIARCGHFAVYLGPSQYDCHYLLTVYSPLPKVVDRRIGNLLCTDQILLDLCRRYASIDRGRAGIQPPRWLKHPRKLTPSK